MLRIYIRLHSLLQKSKGTKEIEMRCCVSECGVRTRLCLCIIICRRRNKNSMCIQCGVRRKSVFRWPFWIIIQFCTYANWMAEYFIVIMRKWCNIWIKPCSLRIVWVKRSYTLWSVLFHAYTYILIEPTRKGAKDILIYIGLPVTHSSS